jgi:Tfp pilus assembly protein PilN
LSLSITAKIDRVQRLVRMLEQDAPLLEMRVSELTVEYQQSAKDYAAQLAAHARAELEKLLEQGHGSEAGDSLPHAAD